MEFLIVFLVLDIVCLVLYYKNRQKSKQAINDKAVNLSSKFDKVIKLGYLNHELNYAGFDNTNKILTIKTKDFSNFIIKYDDIIDIELIENGKSTMSLSNVIGGAFIAGGTGAIVGGMNKNYVVESRKIKFVLNDFNQPSFEIKLSCLNFDNGINILEEANNLIDTVKYVVGNK